MMGIERRIMTINEHIMVILYHIEVIIMRESKDRRIVKTRKSIRDTLLKEMKTESYQELSVSRLCREADIGRGTFYLHYNDIYEVVQEIEDQLLSDFRDMAFRHFDEGTPLSAFLADILIYITKHPDEYEVFLMPSDSRFSIRFLDAALELFYYHAVKYQPSEDPVRQRYRILRNLFGISGAIRSWFAAGCRETPERLASCLTDS